MAEAVSLSRQDEAYQYNRQFWGGSESPSIQDLTRDSLEAQIDSTPTVRRVTSADLQLYAYDKVFWFSEEAEPG